MDSSGARRTPTHSEISPEVAWAGLDELALWCDPDARLCEITPEAMVAAYNAMERARLHLTRAVAPLEPVSPCAGYIDAA